MFGKKRDIINSSLIKNEYEADDEDKLHEPSAKRQKIIDGEQVSEGSKKEMIDFDGQKPQ